jgi:NitT/TauT family transport system substrate-binding protein
MHCTARIFRGAAVLVAVAAAAAGCGGGDGPAESGGTAKLKIGVLPIADVAPLYLGQSKGFFKDEQLEIEPQTTQGGAEVTAGVVSGDFDLGFAATEPLMAARDRDLPVTIVSQGVQASADPDRDWGQLIVPAKSGVRRLQDVEGKTVAVNALKSMPELCVRVVLDRAGVDTDKVKFTEVPFPEMGAALDAGRVDAIAAVEPFVTQALGADGRSLGSYLAAIEPKMTVATYFTLERYTEENRDVVERFTRAMNRSLDYAQSHPDEARRAVTGYTEIPPAVADEMILPFWSSDLNEATIELVARESKRFGIVESEPDVDGMIWEGAR